MLDSIDLFTLVDSNSSTYRTRELAAMEIAGRVDETVQEARILEKLRAIYALEVAAEAIFALMLEKGGPLTFGQRRKIEACRLLEVDMADLVGRHLVMECGAPVGDPSRRLQLSAAARAAIQEDTWHARMVALEVAAAGAVQPFRELKAIYADRYPILCNTLLAHVLLVRDFAHDEAEGDGDDSLGGVVSLLGDEARGALLRFEAGAA